MTYCVHGVLRPEGPCERCDTDSAGPIKLDRCQACGALGTWGIRAHPKYSAKVAIVVNGELDLTSFYAHSEHDIRALVDGLKGVADVASIEHFNGKGWVELPDVPST